MIIINIFNKKPQDFEFLEVLEVFEIYISTLKRYIFSKRRPLRSNLMT